MPSKTHQELARVSAETSERLRMSSASIEQTHQHVKASHEALGHAMQLLASTVPPRAVSRS